VSIGVDIEARRARSLCLRLLSSGPVMIAQIRHRSWAKRTGAAAYQKMLRSQILPQIVDRNICSCPGAELFFSAAEKKVEFGTLLECDWVEAVKGSAGAEECRRVIGPKAKPLVVRMDEPPQAYPIAV
jgi:hypothetical protein